MNLRFILFALFLLSVPLARAQVTYGGNIDLPLSREQILPLATAQLDPTSPDYDPNGDDQSLYLVTPKQYYTYQLSGSSYRYSTVSSFPQSFNLGGGSESVETNRKFQTTGTYGDGHETTNFIMTAARGGLNDFTPSYGSSSLYGLIFPIVKTAVASGHQMTLFATSTAVYTTRPNGYSGTYTGSPFTLTLGATATPQTQFSQITEMSFAPGANGLLYVLDWGNKLVDAFSLSDSGGNVSGSLQLSFSVPAGLENNTTGLGFTINDAGHVLFADGNGGGVETDLLGNVLTTFDPPSGDATGINTVTGDSHYIAYDSAGHIFVEDGANGLHWYQDVATVPEPSTWVLVLGGLGTLGFCVSRRKA